MPATRTVVILHGAVAAGARPDELDVLVQVNAVAAALAGLGYKPVAVPLDLNLARAKERLQRLRPWVVFNLVESIAASDRLALLASCLLDHLGIPYTGTPTNGLALASDKGLTKRWLRQHGLPTPEVAEDATEPGLWIVKSLWEHASFGLDDSSVIPHPRELPAALALRRARYGGDWFAERYVEGREFNVGLLARPEGAQVLPIAEMLFCDYPADKPRIVDYRAKWEPGSFEHRNTARCFEQRPEDHGLRAEITDSAERCWKVFGLRGYARVDFRVDHDGRPWVLEVNTNPCLSPDAGYAAALAEAGISFPQAVARIVEDARREPFSEGSVPLTNIA
ncbi:MAG: D-alanine--D-alanine ligase family protein [Gammaproteobacteria bacterium]